MVTHTNVCEVTKMYHSSTPCNKRPGMWTAAGGGDIAGGGGGSARGVGCAGGGGVKRLRIVPVPLSPGKKAAHDARAAKYAVANMQLGIPGQLHAHPGCVQGFEQQVEILHAGLKREYMLATEATMALLHLAGTQSKHSLAEVQEYLQDVNVVEEGMFRKPCVCGKRWVPYYPSGKEEEALRRGCDKCSSLF
jgi:hypothetical protein